MRFWESCLQQKIHCSIIKVVVLAQAAVTYCESKFRYLFRFSIVFVGLCWLCSVKQVILLDWILFVKFCKSLKRLIDYPEATGTNEVVLWKSCFNGKSEMWQSEPKKDLLCYSIFMKINSLIPWLNYWYCTPFFKPAQIFHIAISSLFNERSQ